MEFGILFTSHPNHVTEPYPHRDVHARVTAEIAGRRSPGLRHRLGGRAPLLEPVRDHAGRLHLHGLSGRADVAHPPRNGRGDPAALRARPRGGEHGLRRHPVGRARDARPRLRLPPVRVRGLRARLRGAARRAGGSDRADLQSGPQAARQAQGHLLQVDDRGRLRGLPGQRPAAAPAALHGGRHRPLDGLRRPPRLRAHAVDAAVGRHARQADRLLPQPYEGSAGAAEPEPRASARSTSRAGSTWPRATPGRRPTPSTASSSTSRIS